MLNEFCVPENGVEHEVPDQSPRSNANIQGQVILDEPGNQVLLPSTYLGSKASSFEGYLHAHADYH